jgi:hypothetical protein
MRSRKAAIMNDVIVQIILIGLIFALFFMANAGKINGRGVRQQVIEKQTALMIDSAVPGMSFGIRKMNKNGIIQDVALRDGKIWIKIDGLVSLKGYPYISRYDIGVVEDEDKFVVYIT